MKKLIMFSALFLLLFLSIINVQQQSMYSEEARDPGYWYPMYQWTQIEQDGRISTSELCVCIYNNVKYCAVGVPDMITTWGHSCSEYNQ